MLAILRNHTVTTGILGSISGWASVDFLRSAQIAAAFLAALVSLGTLIIIAPKVAAQLREWCQRRRG